jgi:hypothetical protein
LLFQVWSEGSDPFTVNAVPKLAVGIDEIINMASKIKNKIRKGKIIE